MSYDVLTAAPNGPVASQSVVTFAYPPGRTRDDYETRGAALSINFGEYKHRQSSGVFSLTYGDTNIRLFWGAGAIPAGKTWTLQAPLTLGAESFTATQPGKLQVVASRGSIPGNTTNATVLTDGTKTRLECRMKVSFGPEPCTDVRVLMANFHATGSSAEVEAPNAIINDVAIEAADASAYAPFKFKGEPTLVNKPGGVVPSDGVPLYFAGSSSAWIRSGAVCANGEFIPISSMFAISGESMPYSTEATSQIMATGALANRTTGITGPGGHIPLAILGIPKKPYPSGGILGDSLGAGTVGDSSSNVTGARGFVQRGFHREDNSLIWPYVNLARASERAEWQTGFSSYLRRSVYPYISYLVDESGTNDIAASTTLANLQAYKTATWANARAFGLKVFVVLLLPRTNAGNTAASTGFATGSTRDQYNAWVLTQLAAGVIDGVIDPNPIAESQTSHGLWANSSWTADGVHLNTTGAPIVAAAVRSVVSTWSLTA